VAAPAFGQQPAFVAPPRTISDITAILDQEKPDGMVVAKMRADAEAEPPAGADRAILARFYYDRSHARSLLGESREALVDAENAAAYAEGSIELGEVGRIKQQLAVQYWQSGNPKKSLQVLLRMLTEYNRPGGYGRLINTYRGMVDIYITLGDLNQAETNARRIQDLIQQLRGSPNYHGFLRSSSESDLEQAQARLFEARGQLRQAEASYRRAEELRRASIRDRNTVPYPPAQSLLEQAADFLAAAQGRVKARQGRIAEGEADVRRALLSRLKASGKYSLQTAYYVSVLANLLVEQGRFVEAEQLTRTQIEIYQAIGVPSDAQNVASALGQLAAIITWQARWFEAAKVYSDLENVTRNWEPSRREKLQVTPAHIITLYNTDNVPAGLAAAEQLLSRNKARFGEQYMGMALTHGLLAAGFARSGRDDDALREFKLAIPILMARSREIDYDDAANAAAREQRVQLVIESYMALLARMGPAAGVDPAIESFQLADTLRGRSVQRAIAASGARSLAGNAELAELVRNAQDMETQIGAELGLLNSVLALPLGERDDVGAKTLQADIDRLRTARDLAKRDLADRFPEYASLVEPVAPTVNDVRDVMRPDEAFLSFYFGRFNSFVWAMGKSGPVAFAAIGANGRTIDTKIQALREALESNAVMISDIPPFDVTLAHELYTLLLKPVESAWKPAKNLVAVTNGALGLLPLGLLPTAPTQMQPSAEPQFVDYRRVPWLSRTHAVALVPSAAAFRTLRQLPPGSEKRELLIGFGDPYFNRRQAAEAAQPDAPVQVAAAATTRGMPLHRRAAPQMQTVDGAELGLLPRLPDTAEELKSIALALQADPSKVLYLGKAANEAVVKNTDLTNYRIIVFATHGLTPGDLDGLHQPALALSAPDVAGVPGDGLLTMEEILALKLDADWVVLSACNTGAGAAQGAEAASGLGRAFFYAGTRAILVTNWSVHSASARELVSDLFRRQTADPKMSRAEALRRAMMALLDEKSSIDDSGQILFTYGHPLFWAPYIIIGDGG
jgi:CHAT domain-containing protein